MDSFLIVTYTDRAAKHTSFVAVGSYDDIYIIVVSLFIELILVIGDGVAVNVRPEGATTFADGSSEESLGMGRGA